MSNPSQGFGFRLSRRYDGAAPNYATASVPIAYNYGTVIADGDPVSLSGGNIVVAAAGTQKLFGIFKGVEYFDTVLARKVWAPSWLAPSTALSGSVLAHVVVDPMAVFLVRAGGSSTAIGQASVGRNIQYGGQSTPVAITGVGTAYADQTTIASTNTHAFRIVGLGSGVGNDNTSGYNIIEVMFNNFLATQTTGL